MSLIMLLKSGYQVTDDIAMMDIIPNKNCRLISYSLLFGLALSEY